MRDLTALVTGASRGIGAAIAVRLAAAGASIAVTARTLDTTPDARLPGSLRETVAAVEAVGGRAVPIVAALDEPDERDGIVAAAEATLGPIDVLVNNAAIALYRPAEELTRSRVRRQMELDFHAPVELALAVLPGMRARHRGWILNISSVLARHPGVPPYEGLAPMVRIGWSYGAAKAALERFTTGLAAEVYDDGVAVNALLPAGGVRTAGYEVIAGSTPMRAGLLEPVEQMAEAALALCTGDPSVLTGRIAVSGMLLAELDRPVRTLDGNTLLPSSAGEQPPRG